MAIYATSSLAFQAVQEAFKLSFTAIYITFLFLFTVINRQAFQLARSYSSLSDIYFTLYGEAKRASIRKRCSQNSQNPFIDERNDFDDNRDTSYPGYMNSNHRKISGFTSFLVYVFAALLLCAAYAGYPLKIVFGELSQPIYRPSEVYFPEVDNNFYSHKNIFDESSDVPYSTEYNYDNTDYYDNWVFNDKSLFDSNENPVHLDIMGSTAYTTEYKNSTLDMVITCAMQDEVQVFSLNMDAYYSLTLSPFAMVPKLHCSLASKQNGQHYNGIYYETKDTDDIFKEVYTEIDRMPYADTNFTLFTLSKGVDNRAILTGKTIIVDSATTNLDQIKRPNITNKTTNTTYYESFISNVETFGYNSSSTFLGILDANSFSTRYITVNSTQKYFEYSAMYYYQEVPHVLTFSVKDEAKSSLDPRYDYFVRNILSYQSGKSTGMDHDTLYYQKVHYRTQTVQYKSTGRSEISPQTHVSFDDSSNITLPIQIYPIMMNVKLAPTAQAILQQFCPDTFFDFYETPFETPGRLMWNISLQIFVIAVLFGLSLVVGSIYFVTTRVSYFHTAPGYYDLLRDYHEKKFGSGSSIRSLFEIIEPATVGIGYNERLDANHVGVLNKAMAGTKPQYNKPFFGKQD